MKKFVLLMLVATVFCGCSGRVGNMQMGTSKSQISRQMDGVKNRASVQDTFGAPDLIFNHNGAQYYEYQTVTGHGRYHWLIPVVGWIMSSWQDEFAYRQTNLFIGFDNADNVRDWNVVQIRGTVD